MAAKVSATIELPPKLVPIFAAPLGTVNGRVLHGGRGGGKSYTAALMALIYGYQKPISVMCARKYFTSIPESFHLELRHVINNYTWLKNFYTITDKSIKGINGTQFNFSGLDINIESIKGKTHYMLWIVDEAEDVSERAWQILEPTIREEGAELWVLYNPQKENSPTNKRFRLNKPDNYLLGEIQYYDNPYFSKRLNDTRLHDKQILDEATYNWIWLGHYLELSESQVFRNKYIIEEFESKADWHNPHQGLDFGFSVDPLAANRVWRRGDTLYVEHEANQLGLELDDTPDFLKKAIPNFEKHPIIADNARPESISYLNRNGLPFIKKAKKGPNSVKEGVSKIKAHKQIVIHPRCVNTIYEFKHYSFKVDRHTGNILTDILDMNNHHIDAIRYACENLNSLVDYKSIIG